MMVNTPRITIAKMPHTMRCGTSINIPHTIIVINIPHAIIVPNISHTMMVNIPRTTIVKIPHTIIYVPHLSIYHVQQLYTIYHMQ